jgi:hypothetical protein
LGVLSIFLPLYSGLPQWCFLWLSLLKWALVLFRQLNLMMLAKDTVVTVLQNGWLQSWGRLTSTLHVENVEAQSHWHRLPLTKIYWDQCCLHFVLLESCEIVGERE